MKIIFWGGTGQAKNLREALPADLDLIAIFDNNEKVISPFEDVPIYYGEKGFLNWKKEQDKGEVIYFVVAIGGQRGITRVSISKWLEKEGLKAYSVIHPEAMVSPRAKIGKGVQILRGAIIETEAVIGDYSIIGAGHLIQHECQVGKGVHACGGGVVGACSSVSDYVTFYTGSMTAPRLKIGVGAVIGMGSVVLKDVDSYILIYGNPANYKRNISIDEL